MNDIERLMKLANALPPRPATLSPVELLPVVRVLRNEKRLTWDAIRDWMEENAGVKHSHSYWASVYKYNSNVPSRAASA